MTIEAMAGRLRSFRGQLRFDLIFAMLFVSFSR